MNTSAIDTRKVVSAGSIEFSDDIGANAQILMSKYGLDKESDIASVLVSFTLNGVTTLIGPGKYKSGILIFDLAEEANSGDNYERQFVLTPGMKDKARAYLTPTVCNKIEGHPTAAALLQDGEVIVSVRLVSGALKINDRSSIQSIIETAFEVRADITPRNVDAQLKEAVTSVIEHLDQGKLRVAEKIDGQWVTHQWLKKAVLLSFRMEDNFFIKGGFTNYYDKVPSKFSDYNAKEFREGGFRVVPPAAARKGSFIAKNVILMPSYVNIGAYVDEGTMVDTWATVGSCAQIGKNVHLSGGVGIGGVLEPVQANPTIIEDNCFIGARSEIVEGVIVGEGSVISMGVYIGQSTKIYDRETGEIIYGRVPPGSVVVSGNLPSKDGSHSLYCAVIVKKVDAKTLAKVGINELLRGI